ncbi:6-bladed beta-propeller [Parabacteroides sp. PF5-9]|uniref:6-bladed beta-propeller n=1 Tax=Parabacteroides sp. PF5-9 TaxID=1742404 RepID=UPI002475D8CC|nr:6-bladed beta-propeller [Parabacteroides sp. PF5-9]MDH6358079.1 hypothetical protein [Parabacteroides sp. PF5-9]
MKNMITRLVIILFITAGCVGCKHPDASEGFFTIDVTATYPKKELILQDFLDVEYIVLETNDEFLCEGIPLAIGNEIIMTRNISGNRDLFLFDRNGKGIKKINRFGESAEEYIFSHNSFLDEENSEIFICDRKILVYDLQGNFKRSFDKKEDASLQDLANFDGESFIWWNSAFNFDIDERAVEMPSFFITSKQDGSTLKEIEIPIEKRKTPVIMWREGDMIYAIGTNNKTIIPYKDEMIFTEASSDTVYRYTHDHKLIPFLARTPSLQSMDPEVYLFPGVITDRYCFMELKTKKRDYPDTSLVLDRLTGETFRSAVYNGDYSNKERVLMYSLGRNGNPNIAFCQKIDAHLLVSAYEKDQLKGELKEIAATLNEESNPVIMLVKYKN